MIVLLLFLKVPMQSNKSVLWKEVKADKIMTRDKWMHFPHPCWVFLHVFQNSSVSEATLQEDNYVFLFLKVHVQTNEDALCEEVQTDEITTRDKWTQKPVHISVGADNQLPGPQDYMGVGGDVDPIEFSAVPRKTANTGYLTTFLTSASQVIWTDICTV